MDEFPSHVHCFSRQALASNEQQSPGSRLKRVSKTWGETIQLVHTRIAPQTFFLGNSCPSHPHGPHHNTSSTIQRCNTATEYRLGSAHPSSRSLPHLEQTGARRLRMNDERGTTETKRNATPRTITHNSPLSALPPSPPASKLHKVHTKLLKWLDWTCLRAVSHHAATQPGSPSGQ